MNSEQPGRDPVRRTGRWAPLLAGLTLGACGLWAPALRAGEVSVPAWEVAEVKAWVQRVQHAAMRRNYQGTLVVTAGGTASTTRITHLGDGAAPVERVEWLDGEPRSVIRHNGLLHTLWHRQRLAVVEARETAGGFPALPTGSDRRLTEGYEVRSAGQDRVAGLEADVVLLKARDGLRFSQRLWVERQHGLLLRADVLAAGGQVLESAAFTELSLVARAQPDQLLKPLRQLSGYKVLKASFESTQLQAEGWGLKALPVGFREVQCARRVLDVAATDAAPLVQAVFSDGLTHVSVFIEGYQPARHAQPGLSSLGAAHTLTTRHEDHWITVVGDVPPETLQRFAGALERLR
ncbi:MucB/RseB C-terminal domain-containing protein [Ideonella livida]|uniref:Transcriptional regulator n=1 Tax=Ideonella livida TaxID=2707176 RepID=A0A7C9PH41_9BURK|nr:MucB/RseB C-terminal domain-containing protein [Ideonella livida]NDY91608.1 transcriptional regulator [Ideonella livida]